MGRAYVDGHYADVYPKWLGWAALILGIVGALVDLTQAYQGTSDLFPTVSVLRVLSFTTGQAGLESLDPASRL